MSFFILFLFSQSSLADDNTVVIPCQGVASEQDTAWTQVLYNGRLWRNIHYLVKGDQFLFTPGLLTGTVTIEEKVFRNVFLSYDIYNDELLAMNDKDIMIQLNKEKIEDFTLDYNLRTYKFKNLDSDSLSYLNGFVNVLFQDGIALVVKHRKVILMLAVDNKYDAFSESHRIYIRKDGDYNLIRGKGDLLKLFDDHKKQVRQFIRTNHHNISRKDPDSFIPVVEYYNNLIK